MEDYSNLQNIGDTVIKILTEVSREVLKEQDIEMTGILKVRLSDLHCNKRQTADILQLARDNPNDITKLEEYLKKKENSNIKKSTTTTTE
jgi:hypothetical protein